MKKKILVVTYGASRDGGIEEVSRQVSYIFNETKNFSCKLLIYKGGRLGIILSTLRVLFWVIVGYQPMIMHPFIFEKVNFITLISQKTIVWAYGIDVWGRYGLNKAPAIIKAHKIIAISSYTKERIQENHLSAKNIYVIPLAVDPHRVNCSQIAPKSDNNIITVSRLAANERYKGHDVVLHALSLLKTKGISPIYNIVGKGDDIERLKKLVEALHLSNQVRFHGYVPDSEIGDIYQRSNIFVMPSFVKKSENEIWGGEGFGLVYLEAGLHRLPVIACDEGGQTDCIIDGKTGFLVKPEPEQVAEKIEILLKNSQLAQEMGEAGYDNVMNNFTFERFKRDVLQLID